MKHLKHSLLLLLFVLLMSVTAVSASAVSRGDCGANAHWELSDAGILTISGSGEVTQPEYYINYVKEIKGIVVKDGITAVCDRAFAGLSSARAMAIRCACPSLRPLPRSPSCVSSPSGKVSTKSAQAVWSTSRSSASVASGLANRRL